MVQLEILRYFNSKCENKSLLVIKPPCGVLDGLVNFGCQMVTYTHNVNNELSNSLKKFYTTSNVCYTASTSLIVLKLL